MNPFETKISALESIKSKMPTIILQEALKHRDWIKQANKEQLQAGERSDGTQLPDYVDNSKAPSAPGPIKLFETGDFHEGIEPLFDESGIEMIGLDTKTGLLTGKYGELILGLSEKNISELQSRMLPGIQNTVRAMI